MRMHRVPLGLVRRPIGSHALFSSAQQADAGAKYDARLSKAFAEVCVTLVQRKKFSLCECLAGPADLYCVFHMILLNVYFNDLSRASLTVARLDDLMHAFTPSRPLHAGRAQLTHAAQVYNESIS